MRTTLRRASLLVAIATVVMSSSMVFQNCSSYQSGEIPLTDVTFASTCAPGDCPTNPESILLAIGNSDPERLIASDRAFDIAGYCDPAGYPGNRIVWRVTGPTSIGPGIVDNACDELGRFHIRVDLPDGYTFGALHTLQIQLKGVDDRGNEIDNPLGLNKKEIGLASNPP